MERDPADRYQTAPEFAAAFAQATKSGTSVTGVLDRILRLLTAHAAALAAGPLQRRAAGAQISTMKRYAAFEPPEYVTWTPDDAEVERFDATIARHAERAAIIDALSEAQLLDLYAGLARTRLIDVALKRFVKQGVISKAWLGTGEEAATVGPVHALRRGPERGHCGAHDS